MLKYKENVFFYEIIIKYIHSVFFLFLCHFSRKEFLIIKLIVIINNNLIINCVMINLNVTRSHDVK